MVRIRVTFLCSLTGIRAVEEVIVRSTDGSRVEAFAAARRCSIRADQPVAADRARPRAAQVGLIQDLVAVSLLGQEELAMVGEIHLAGVAAHQRVEARGQLALLGAEDPPQPLGFLLPAAERARDLDHHVGVGQVDGEVADLREDQPAQHAAAELAVQLLALGVGGLAGDQRDVEPLGDPPQLLEVLADDQHAVVGPVVAVEQSRRPARP